MGIKKLFEHALRLEWPWYVDRTRFDDETRQLDVHLNFQAGGIFPCGGCGQGCKAYDTAWKQWRHLNFFECHTLILAPSPRVNCHSCGVRQAGLPWTRPRCRFTLPFEALVVAMTTEMSVRAVGRIVGEHDTRLWRIVNHYMRDTDPAAGPEAQGDTQFEDESTRAPGPAAGFRQSAPHAKTP